MLELGGGVGALIVHTGPEREGEEIEIAPLKGDAVPTHAEVRERRLGARNLYCAVYYGLAAGDTPWRSARDPTRRSSSRAAP